MQEVRGCHAPSFLIFAKSEMQNPNIQPEVL